MRLIRSCAIAGLSVMLFGASACKARPNVVITTRTGTEVPFTVEVAGSASARELGLQYRRELADDRGMIFLFPNESEHSFWMKNTVIPLDMIFIGSDRRIVGIVERAAPFSLDSRSVEAPSQFVLEINGGLSRRYGIQAGDSVRFDGVPVDSARE